MSQEKRTAEAVRWLKTAEEDLAAAVDLRRTGHFAQACFYAQQAGEKALKALWYFVDLEPWGHSVQKLAIEFSDTRQAAAVKKLAPAGAALDKFYIPTRYPNGLPDLTPGVSYGDKDAERAFDAAREILTAVKEIMG